MMMRAGLAGMALALALSAPALAQEKASVRLKWLTQAQFAGLYVAKAKGFYLAEGIDLTINPGGPKRLFSTTLTSCRVPVLPRM